MCDPLESSMKYILQNEVPLLHLGKNIKCRVNCHETRMKTFIKSDNKTNIDNILQKSKINLSKFMEKRQLFNFKKLCKNVK